MKHKAIPYHSSDHHMDICHRTDIDHHKDIGHHMDIGRSIDLHMGSKDIDLHKLSIRRERKTPKQLSLFFFSWKRLLENEIKFNV